VRIFTLPLNCGHVIRGLLSESADQKVIVIHFHGFGGDCFANSFLHTMHENFHRHGISFLSVNTRYSGYLVEEYSETNVTYSGASIEKYSNTTEDVRALVDYFHDKYTQIVLQGHSFGTNLVKLFLRKNNSRLPAIFLSPADSVTLYKKWHNDRVIENISASSSAYVIRTDNFGMLTDYGEYRIPMSDFALDHLLVSDIFNEWSLPIKPIVNHSLVIKGGSDKLSNCGTTENDALIKEQLPISDCFCINTARHIFSKHEDVLFEIVKSWVQKLF